MSEFKNPLPPPPRKPAGGGGGGMSNKDFSKLLATPRPGARSQLSSLPSGAKVTMGGGQEPEGGGGGAPKTKRRPWKPKNEEEKEEEDEGPKYRDRAKERREGRMLDYDSANSNLAALMEGQEVDVSKISVEESKYLGGDVEHTHLVKGLDFALLQKVRGEQKKEERGKDGGEEGSAASSKVDEKPLRFITPMGRAIYQAVLDPPPYKPVETFLPGRMAFLFSFEEDELGNPPPDTPTILRRSKADCPKLPPKLLGGMDGALLERIATVMSYVQLAAGGKKPKIKKKDRARLLGDYALDERPEAKATATATAAQPPPAHASGDEDIFDDAGKDYVCDLETPKTDGNGKATGTYFDTKDEMDDLPPLQGPARPPPGAQTSYFYPDGDDVDMEVEGEEEREPLPPPPPEEEPVPELPRSGQSRTQPKKEVPKKQELKGFADEAYAECFPEFHHMGAEVADSDDEGGADKMDLGRQGARVKTRYDFSTEEEYNQYKASQEANPKAAFQFGVKRDGGRKSTKALQGGKANPDSKVNSELGKIKNILKDKGHTKDLVAFETARDESAAPGTKRRKRV